MDGYLSLSIQNPFLHQWSLDGQSRFGCKRDGYGLKVETYKRRNLTSDLGLGLEIIPHNPLFSVVTY